MPIPAPPLSLRGIRAALRPPTLQDWVFSLKIYLATALALLAGFSQNLENPYWAGLSIYILAAMPGSGTIRSKALFRIGGTLIGCTLAVILTGMFGDQLGILGATILAGVAICIFLRQIDRTPASYTFFSGGITLAVIGLANLMQPGVMFDRATARGGETMVGILALAAMDSLFWPRPALPGFLHLMTGWRGRARAWLDDALAHDAPPPADAPSWQNIRLGLRELCRAVAVIDAQAVELPFDIVRKTPRTSALDLVRYEVVELIATLTALRFSAQSLTGRPHGARFAAALAAFRDWLQAEPEQPDASAPTRERSGALAARLEADQAALRAADEETARVERGLLMNMAVFVAGWSRLSQGLEAVREGRALPPELAAIARRVKPVRSIDYAGAALDVAPLLLSMSFALLLWYLTAWVSGAGALLFSFVGGAFLIGQGNILPSAAGVLGCILTAFTLVFLYQFAVLPRVTDFPVLVGVLGCALVPFGLLMSMSMSGMLICVFCFAFLGLQSTYSGDFEQSLETLVASLTGLLIAVASLHLCAYDHGRFAARRLQAAVRRDVRDIALSRRLPDRRRYLLLAVDRLALFFTAAEQLAAGGPLPRIGMIRDFAVGDNLLLLREQERGLAPPARGTLRELRQASAAAYRPATPPRDGGAAETRLRDRVDAAIVDPAIRREAASDQLLLALTRLRLALAGLGGAPAVREPASR